MVPRMPVLLAPRAGSDGIGGIGRIGPNFGTFRPRGLPVASHVLVGRDSSKLQSRTMPLPAGRSPFLSEARTAGPAIGNSPTRSGAARARVRRLCRVSATRRMTTPLWSSRRLSATLRVHACTSRRRDSASTGTRQPGPPITASHARWSPAMLRGTSVRHVSGAGSKTRSLATSASWATSRIGSPDAKVRMGTSKPSTAPIRTRVSYGTRVATPRSIRLISAWDLPTDSPT